MSERSVLVLGVGVGVGLGKWHDVMMGTGIGFCGMEVRGYV